MTSRQKFWAAALGLTILATAGNAVPGVLAMPAPPGEANTAPIALLVDLDSGQTLYARAADRRFPPASVTKTMTAFVAFSLLAEGRLRPDQTMTVSDVAWRQWHAIGSRMFLHDGQRVSVDDLLTGIMNVSANDGAVVLAEGAAGSVGGWVAAMNEAARALGMVNSHFGTPNGWMDGGHTYFTARDLVTLADAMISRYPAYYHRYVGKRGMRFNGIAQDSHNPLLGIPGADGIKTGYTSEARYTFLGSAQRNGRRLVVVLAGVPTEAARAAAARALIEWGFAAWEDRAVLPAGAHVGDGLSAAGAVPLVSERSVVVTVPAGTRRMVTLSLDNASVRTGTTVAQLAVQVEGEPPVLMPLLAGTAVRHPTAWDRLTAWWRGQGR